MKSLFLSGLMLILFQAHAQSWEPLLEEYTYVYDIIDHDSILSIVGLKDGNFIFCLF